MNLDELTQDQRQAIHRGLKLSEVDLERLRKNALGMGLPGAVHEVDEHLRMLRGGPDGTAGLLQLFANQTELFVEGADRDERQLDLADGGENAEGGEATGNGEGGIAETDISTSLEDYEGPEGEHPDDAPPGPLADTVAKVVEKARTPRKPRPKELREREARAAKKGKGGKR